MKRIASILICATVLWAIPALAQADKQSGETPSYVSVQVRLKVGMSHSIAAVSTGKEPS